MISAVAATGSSIVVNTSPDLFYLWVVPDATGAPIGNRITVVAGGAWAEPLHVGRFGNSSSTTGVAIKISTDIEGLYNSAPLQILGYTLAGDRVWYNLDAVNGAPFKGQDVKVTSQGAGTIEWPNGEDVGDVTRDNAADKDIVLVVSGKV
ncbi:uncharacterized protein N0V89_008623 [Didymosphaeria variabile]|uniref:Uncharacterized protein n=1 Tax=Didymosphaeria variabile TaxID=1932322 RepID=A0A9W9C9G6_9PLEO|nr:uncharacterized protein N0V89_008623 [Didymosphaeria variabile]KAJ4350002.1 hypothetical protein N0V89_008623 [Didymosphaeria variabile]